MKHIPGHTLFVAASLGLSVAVLSAAVPATAMAAETESYTGSGRYVSEKLSMNLGNGDIIVGGRSEGIASISTNPPTLLFTKCLALANTDGAERYNSDFYCTFREDDGNAFDIKGEGGSKGGTAKVIGGSGKWQGATGSITFERRSDSWDEGGSYAFEMTVTRQPPAPAKSQ